MSAGLARRTSRSERTRKQRGEACRTPSGPATSSPTATAWSTCSARAGAAGSGAPTTGCSTGTSPARDRRRRRARRRAARRRPPLRHGPGPPHLLRVLDADQRDDLCFVVNEWGSGTSLDIMLADDGPLAPRRAAWLVAEVAASIAVAHDAGVAHGRLVPENVLVDRNGSVRVIGFARRRRPARAAPGPRRATTSPTSAACSTPPLTGRWAGVSRSACRRRPSEHGRVLRPRQVRAGIPRPLDALCDQVLNPYATPARQRRVGPRPDHAARDRRLPAPTSSATPTGMAEAEAAARQRQPETVPAGAAAAAAPAAPPTNADPAGRAGRGRATRSARGAPGDQPAGAARGRPSPATRDARSRPRPHDVEPEPAAPAEPRRTRPRPDDRRSGRAADPGRPADLRRRDRRRRVAAPPAPSRRPRRRRSRSLRSARCSPPSPPPASRSARPPRRGRARRRRLLALGLQLGTGAGSSPAPARASSPARTDPTTRCPGAAGCGWRALVAAGAAAARRLVVAYNLGRGTHPARRRAHRPGDVRQRQPRRGATAPAAHRAHGLRPRPAGRPAEENPELAPLAVDGDPAHRLAHRDLPAEPRARRPQDRRRPGRRPR